MDRIRGRRVLVTGASAGIGAACAEAFASHGADLVLVARREDRLRALSERLRSEHGVQCRAAILDVRDRAAVDRLGDELDEEGVELDVILNNAGLGRGFDPLHEGKVEDWEEMIDTNVKGLLYVTRRFLPAMVRRDAGHVVNLGSSAAWMVYPNGNVYNATKYAVRALTQGISVDLHGTRVRVSSIDPAIVETEFSRVRYRGDEDRAGRAYEGYTPLSPADVAEAACWVVAAPEHVNVLHVIMHSIDQRNAYLLNRNSDG